MISKNIPLTSRDMWKKCVLFNSIILNNQHNILKYDYDYNKKLLQNGKYFI